MEDDDRRPDDATVDADDQPPPAPGSWTEDDEDDDGTNGEELDPRVQVSPHCGLTAQSWVVNKTDYPYFAEENLQQEALI